LPDERVLGTFASVTNAATVAGRRARMKAVVMTRYGSADRLRLTDVERPVPRDTEILVRVRATTVTAGDVEIRTLAVPPWLKVPIRIYVGLAAPRGFILGQELAGDVVTVGSSVTRFREGDAVFGTTGFRFGAHAEYACLPGNAVVAAKPAGLTYEEAAAVPVGGLEALHFLERARIRAGEKVLVIGAGGSIGTFAVQIAKHLGADVTGVDSAGKLAMVRSIGADHVMDYTKEDFSRSGPAWDVIFDVLGRSSFPRCLQSLLPGGRYLLGGNSGPLRVLRGKLVSMAGSRKVIVGAAAQRTRDLLVLEGLIEAGRLKPVVDRSYPLEQAADAHRYVESGQKRGNVVLTMPPAAPVPQEEP
jgi:NADPH:quinone reductase-like Zn-dependent oxidoreductase